MQCFADLHKLFLPQNAGEWMFFAGLIGLAIAGYWGVLPW